MMNYFVCTSSPEQHVSVFGSDVPFRRTTSASFLNQITMNNNLFCDSVVVEDWLDSGTKTTWSGLCKDPVWVQICTSVSLGDVRLHSCKNKHSYVKER